MISLARADGFRGDRSRVLLAAGFVCDDSATCKIKKKTGGVVSREGRKSTKENLMRLLTAALLVGVAIGANVGLAADSYENHGANRGVVPPVPGSALWLYKPGMCWKAKDSARQVGHYIPCSEFFKKGKRT
jgi:hypothetical protein